MSVRRPSHAGSWYSDDGATLQAQIDKWLDLVPSELEGVGSLPVPGPQCMAVALRLTVCRHAGYSYSGPCAAFAYKCLDLTKA
ncbi:hypothetical protein MferCBS31731_002262 [Microsporum ferrugineum]